MDKLISLAKSAQANKKNLTNALVGTALVCAVVFGLTYDGSAKIELGLPIENELVAHTALGIVFLILGIWIVLFEVFHHEQKGYFESKRGRRFLAISAVFLVIWIPCSVVALFVANTPVESALWGIRLAVFVAQCVSAFMSY